MKHVDLLETSIACNGEDRIWKELREVLKAAGTDVDAIRAKHLRGNEITFPFSSTRKRKSIIIENATGDGGYDRRIFV